MEFMWGQAGCNGKDRKLPRTCLVPDPVVLVFVCWPPNAPNSSAAWPPALRPNKTPIVPRSSCASPPIRPTPPLRRRWDWQCVPFLSGAIASSNSAWMDSRTIPNAHRHASTTPTSRLDCSCWPARNHPTLIRREPGRPTGVSTTWRSMWPLIPSSAWVIPARARSGSSSSGTRFAWTVFSTWMNDRDPEFATKAVAIIELLLDPPTDGPLFCSTNPSNRRGGACISCRRGSQLADAGAQSGEDGGGGDAAGFSEVVTVGAGHFVDQAMGAQQAEFTTDPG